MDKNISKIYSVEIDNQNFDILKTIEDIYDFSEKIDSTSALKNKFLVMGLLAVIFTFIRSIINFIYWDPLMFKNNNNYPLCIKIFYSINVIFQIFIMSGAILFAGMAGECFSIPLDLITSLINDLLSFILRMPHHSFLSEYMINLTISGIHVWNCLRLLGCKFNMLSGSIVISILEKYIDLNDGDIQLLRSSNGAHDIFDLKQMTISNPKCIITYNFIRKYAILFSKMFVFSFLARCMAFGMLWVTTLIPIIMEPMFGLNSLIFGLVNKFFGQFGVATLAILWSVIMGIFLGEKQSTSGGKEQILKPANKIEGIYYFIYNLLFKNLEDKFNSKYLNYQIML